MCKQSRQDAQKKNKKTLSWNKNIYSEEVCTEVELFQAPTLQPQNIYSGTQSDLLATGLLVMSPPAWWEKNIGSCLTIIWILFPLWREAAGERWKCLKGQKRCCLLINSKEALGCCPCLQNVTRHSCCLKGLQASSIIPFIIIRLKKIKRILHWYVRRYTFSAVSVWSCRGGHDDDAEHSAKSSKWWKRKEAKPRKPLCLAPACLAQLRCLVAKNISLIGPLRREVRTPQERTICVFA